MRGQDHQQVRSPTTNLEDASWQSQTGAGPKESATRTDRAGVRASPRGDCAALLPSLFCSFRASRPNWTASSGQSVEAKLAQNEQPSLEPPRSALGVCPRALPICSELGRLFLESHPTEGLGDEFVGRLEKWTRELGDLCADIFCLREQLEC